MIFFAGFVAAFLIVLAVFFIVRRILGAKKRKKMQEEFQDKHGLRLETLERHLALFDSLLNQNSALIPRAEYNELWKTLQAASQALEGCNSAMNSAANVPHVSTTELLLIMSMHELTVSVGMSTVSKSLAEAGNKYNKLIKLGISAVANYKAADVMLVQIKTCTERLKERHSAVQLSAVLRKEATYRHLLSRVETALTDEEFDLVQKLSRKLREVGDWLLTAEQRIRSARLNYKREVSRARIRYEEYKHLLYREGRPAISYKAEAAFARMERNSQKKEVDWLYLQLTAAKLRRYLDRKVAATEQAREYIPTEVTRQTANVEAVQAIIKDLVLPSDEAASELNEDHRRLWQSAMEQIQKGHQASAENNMTHAFDLYVQGMLRNTLFPLAESKK